MVCKYCGEDSVIKEEERYICKNCGAVAVAAENAETPEEPENEGDNEEEKPKKSPMRDVLEFCIPIVLALIIAMLLKTFVFANAQVPTGSMLNTIQLEDRIIASRLEYRFHDPERGDIIIFQAPDDVEDHKLDRSVEIRYFVKRIIGLPGETVTIVNGVVYIEKTDGTTLQLDEPYITACIPEGDYGPYEVPENHYFVMGDNRNGSSDAREWRNTYLDRELIIGKVKFRYLPKFTVFEQPVYEDEAVTAE